MSTKIIIPDALDTLATAPQCVDNQYVPEKLFERIKKRGKSLKQVVDRILEEHGGDPFMGPSDDDAKILLRTQRNEYNRSLIYARQVVVNRAAFWNSPALVVSELTDDVEYLAELIRNQSIVPYLYKETSFEQPPSNFDLFLGKKAMKYLVNALGTSPIRCVRLSPNEIENNDQTKNLSTRFYTEFTKLLKFENKERIDQIAHILLPENIDDEVLDGAKKKIREVAKKIDQLTNNQVVGREHVYQAFIVTPGTKVSHGFYRSEKLTFEIKKWVDAIYSSNLPDALGILTFVPEGLPTAYDLGMIWSLGRKRKKNYTGTDLFDEVIDRARNKNTWDLWNKFQQSANLILPSPDQLTHKDILEIRNLDSWEQMMIQLEDFLDPKPMNEVVREFDYKQSVDEMLGIFSQFNRALSAWYLQKTGMDRQATAEKFAVCIGRIYQLGKWMVGLLFSREGALFPILPLRGVLAPNLDQDNLRFGIEAGLFFVNEKGINWRRSQLIQKMQNQLTVGTDEVKKMVEDIIGLFPETAPYLKPSLSAEMEG